MAWIGSRTGEHSPQEADGESDRGDGNNRRCQCVRLEAGARRYGSCAGQRFLGSRTGASRLGRQEAVPRDSALGRRLGVGARERRCPDKHALGMALLPEESASARPILRRRLADVRRTPSGPCAMATASKCFLPSSSVTRMWCRLDASASPYRHDEVNRTRTGPLHRAISRRRPQAVDQI
jgi:hypothetical protein